MSTVRLKDAKAGLSGFVDDAFKGEFVTITRHGKPVAALVSIEAAEIARRSMSSKKISLIEHLMAFPGADLELDRPRTPSRDVDL